MQYRWRKVLQSQLGSIKKRGRKAAEKASQDQELSQMELQHHQSASENHTIEDLIKREITENEKIRYENGYKIIEKILLKPDGKRVRVVSKSRKKTYSARGESDHLEVSNKESVDHEEPSEQSEVISSNESKISEKSLQSEKPHKTRKNKKPKAVSKSPKPQKSSKRDKSQKASKMPKSSKKLKSDKKDKSPKKNKVGRPRKHKQPVCSEEEEKSSRSEPPSKISEIIDSESSGESLYMNESACEKFME